jgi:hypothetical protein
LASILKSISMYRGKAAAGADSEPDLPQPGGAMAGESAPAPVVMEELERILSSAHFRNSKRYPALLRFVVERTLEGRGDEIKERSIAMDVFGRQAGYDPSVDPVVRISAGEVRKRLAQYYQEPGHEGEIRIELPLGSYQPEFIVAAQAPAGSGVAPVVASAGVARKFLIPGLVCAAIVVAVLLFRPWRTPTALEQFWQPVVSPAGSPVMICFAATEPIFPQEASRRILGARRVVWWDAETLARLAGIVQSRGAALQLVREDQATFDDFQRVPAILIGAFNDAWTLRLMEKMRFTFQREGTSFWIADRDNPGQRRWKIDLGQFDSSGRPVLKEDFAVVSRVSNPRTGRITITVAGLYGYGTLAAGKFLTDQTFLQKMSEVAPAGWQDRNMQIVIGTEVIQENSGPPRILATAFW